MVRHRKRNPRRHQQTLIEWFQNANSNQRLIHHIPHEIIEEILSRLPVKSLLKLRCVSKSWCSLISSPDFINTHLQNSSKNMRVLLTIGGYDVPRHLKSFSLNSFLYNQEVDSIVIPWDRFDVVDCYNGLFCISSIDGDDLLLWNPSTRRYRKLPDSMDYYADSCFHGFGFDDSTNDYKIVKVMLPFLCDTCNESYSDGSEPPFYRPTVKVYSLKTDSWKRIEDFPGHPTSTSSKFLNGKFHWPSYYPYRTEIVSLDIQTEVYEIIQLPFPNSGSIDLSLGLLGGCLSMIVTSSDEDHMNLWILKEYGVKESWTNVVNIPSIHHKSYIRESALCMLSDGQILLLFGSTFVLYNPKEQSLRKTVVNNSSIRYGVNIYVESLLSPCADDGPWAQFQ